MAGTLDNSKIIQVVLTDVNGVPGGDGGGSPVSNPENPLDPVTSVGGGCYIFAATGSNWTTQTLTVQFLLPDGETWANAKNMEEAEATLTAPGSFVMMIGSNATIKVVTSAAISNLVWNLS